MSGAREWFSTGEIAALGLPGLPGTIRAIQIMAARERWGRPEWRGSHWRERQASGGGIEYHFALLPRAAQVKLALDREPAAEADERAAAKCELGREDLWAWFERQPETKRAEARRRLEVLQSVEQLVRAGVGKVVAAQEIAARSGVALSGLYRWQKLVHGIDRHDWLPHLAPRHVGRAETAECPPEAWAVLKADYLRQEQPAFTDCHRRLRAIAAERGWRLPSEKTLARRMEALPAGMVTLLRKGPEALKRMYPAQTRNRTVFHALEAVNADGHKWDVFVRWPDGQVGRPVMVAFQDLYSGRILSWRCDRTENKEAVRLAFGDLVEAHGVPDHCLLDNGRNFASKWLTGGTPNRYRFTVRDEDPAGIMTQLGVQVHWATPYSGQSKPIERAFRDLAGGLARHPRFAGAWTGNTVAAKPENYASHAVPLDVFLGTVAEGIAEHNARPGRKSRVCGGTQSFDQAFAESYARSPIRRATEEQRRLWLLAAEAVSARQPDGAVHLLGNRYWGQFLGGHIGQKVVARFDPQAMDRPLHLYRLDGAYLGAAPCIEATGFLDAAAAQEHARMRKRFLRANKELAAIENALSARDAAAMLPAPAEPAPPPERKLVRPVFGPGFGSAARKPMPIEAEQEDETEIDRLFCRAVEQQHRKGGLRVVPKDDAG